MLSSQANIRNTFCDQRSPQPLEVGVLQCRRQTGGHGDSMTDLALRAKSVKTYWVALQCNAMQCNALMFPCKFCDRHRFLSSTYKLLLCIGVISYFETLCVFLAALSSSRRRVVGWSVGLRPLLVHLYKKMYV